MDSIGEQLSVLPEDLRALVASGEIEIQTALFVAKHVAGHEAMRTFVQTLHVSGCDLKKKIKKQTLEASLPIPPHASFEGFADEFLASTYRYRSALEAFVGTMERGAWGELRRPHRQAVLRELLKIAQLSLRFEALETGRGR